MTQYNTREEALLAWLSFPFDLSRDDNAIPAADDAYLNGFAEVSGNVQYGFHVASVWTAEDTHAVVLSNENGNQWGLWLDAKLTERLHEIAAWLWEGDD